MRGSVRVVIVPAYIYVLVPNGAESSTGISADYKFSVDILVRHMQ